MTLPIEPPILPMEARSATDIPEGPEWQYEPKWDGFRCVTFRDNAEVVLQSKAGQPLQRYFPDVVTAVLALKPKQFVLDGELVIPADAGLSFDALLLRIHPAATRVRKLAQESPALLVAFDLLVDDAGRLQTGRPLRERRVALEAFASRNLVNGTGGIRLSPATAQLAEARKWLRTMGGSLDGIVAKRLDARYSPGERESVVKVKFRRTVDCVVGGFRYAEGKPYVGSLLLGLYNKDGLLDHVGFTSGIKAADREELTKNLEKLRKSPGFTGRAPGGPSRWSKRSGDWQPLAPKLVVEVEYDHWAGGRFRHGTKLLRWRPDKAPSQCTLEQVEREGRSPMLLL